MSPALLLKELQFLQRNLPLYLKLWPEGKNDWRPAPEMFTLFQLACHLCASPSFYTAMLAEEPQEEIFQWDVPLQEGGAEDLRELLDAGMHHLQMVLKSFSDEEFTSKEIPQPFGPPMTPEAMVMGLVTHMYHHRGQLHNYLRQLGAPVSSDTVYGTEAEPE